MKRHEKSCKRLLRDLLESDMQPRSFKACLTTKWTKASVVTILTISIASKMPSSRLSRIKSCARCPAQSRKPCCRVKSHRSLMNSRWLRGLRFSTWRLSRASISRAVTNNSTSSSANSTRNWIRARLCKTLQFRGPTRWQKRSWSSVRIKFASNFSHAYLITSKNTWLSQESSSQSCSSILPR